MTTPGANARRGRSAQRSGASAEREVDQAVALLYGWRACLAHGNPTARRVGAGPDGAPRFALVAKGAVDRVGVIWCRPVAIEVKSTSTRLASWTGTGRTGLTPGERGFLTAFAGAGGLALVLVRGADGWGAWLMRTPCVLARHGPGPATVDIVLRAVLRPAPDHAEGS